ncbi:MAG: RluA family pseudouridine synthase [Roseburia sp.]
MIPAILYEDDAILVCVKAAGVATQTKKLGQPDMESILKNYRAGKGEPPYIGIVHRLDQPVSGVMVFAKTKEAAAALSKQIAVKSADKYYYAVTDGVPSPAGGTLEHYLLRDGKTNTSRVAGKETPEAKKAILSYEVLEQNTKQALVRIKLETGRHHQIRVQMAEIGCPLVGDRKYNFKENMKMSTQGLCLCSYKIAFRHPVTKKKMEFEIDNPFTLT